MRRVRVCRECFLVYDYAISGRTVFLARQNGHDKLE